MMWLNKCFDFNYWIKFNEKRKCLMKTADFCLHHGHCFFEFELFCLSLSWRFTEINGLLIALK